jgi:hypothetical protein
MEHAEDRPNDERSGFWFRIFAIEASERRWRLTDDMVEDEETDDIPDIIVIPLVARCCLPDNDVRDT